jgi:hemerythrin-like metal-binding protein
MALFVWSEEYSVGVARIDQQHQGLVEIINLLHSEMLLGRGKHVLDVILDKLVDYTKIHFATEEKLFATHGYPQEAEHKGQHQALTEKVLAFQSDFKAGHAVISAGIMEFLRDWLIAHILKEDMAYRTFLVSKGVD